ncbi:MAG: hypothetical protein Q4F83_12740 [Eubacteriales bacterium]|nr:hypothetical protein [Eubacteriales bacterium]
MENTGLGPHGRSFDVFQDGTVQFVDVLGHSAGTTGVPIHNQGKFVLITADACYNRQSWEQMCLPGITVNRDKAEASFNGQSGRSFQSVDEALQINGGHLCAGFVEKSYFYGTHSLKRLTLMKNYLMVA